jgi:hypothetical protein
MAKQFFTIAPTSLEVGSFGRKEPRKQNSSSPSSPAGLSSEAVVKNAIHASISGAYAPWLRIPFPLKLARSSQSLQTAGQAGSLPYSSSMKSMPSMVQYPEPTHPGSASLFRSNWHEAHKAYRPLGKLEAHLLFIHEIHAIHGSISRAYAPWLRIPFPLTPARSPQSLQTAGQAGSSPYFASQATMRRCWRLNSMPMQSTGTPSARYRSA